MDKAEGLENIVIKHMLDLQIKRSSKTGTRASAISKNSKLGFLNIYQSHYFRAEKQQER